MTMRSMLSLPKLFLLVLVLLQSVVVNSSVDWFDALDENHDGSINREEYDHGMSKLDVAMHGAVPPGGASASSSSGEGYFASLHTVGGFWNGFSSGVMMILATEIGDKTFFIAAVLSMRHDRSAVFCGAILALIIMTILSSCMGLVLPQFVPRQYTHILGGVLFLYFGIKLILDSRKMESNRVSEELEEVEEELLHPKKDEDAEDEENSNQNSQAPQSSQRDFLSSNPQWYQVALQSLSLTFLAEWGDRSQIATIALAAAKNPYGVTLGGCIGHSMCTGVAVIGGRMLAARISEKTVSFWGGLIFLVFSVHSIFLEE